LHVYLFNVFDLDETGNVEMSNAEDEPSQLSDGSEGDQNESADKAYSKYSIHSPSFFLVKYF